MRKDLYICDRCHTESYTKMKTITINSEYDGAFIKYEDCFDLCDSCYEEFKKWLKTSIDKIKEAREISKEIEKQKQIKYQEDIKDAIRMKFIGCSSDESHYECPECKKDYGSWYLFNNHREDNVLTCECGQKLIIPR